MSLRDAPDSQPLSPDFCGHAVRFLSSAVDCTRRPGHAGAHEAIEVDATATRSGLGAQDALSVAVVVKWYDDRRAGTVGDIRAAVRQSGGVVIPRPDGSGA